MVSTSFPRYQLEEVVSRVVEQHIAECDARYDREEERSTRQSVTGTVLSAKSLGDGRWAIGTIANELEGEVYTILWDPRTDATELRLED